jgi:tRNA(adenine34) deaminase
MNNEYFMRQALKQAKKAYEKLEVPVGVVIVKDNKIIARAYNQKEEKNSPIKHAEIIAIEKACKNLNNWRLNDCEMYVTLEPCPMSAGAIVNSRIKKVYIGAAQQKTGACGSKLNIIEEYRTETKVDVEFDLLKKECLNILQEFFKELRKKDKENS